MDRGSDRGGDRQAQMQGQRNGMYNASSSSGPGGMKKPEDRQRGWQDSPYSNASPMQPQGASDWSNANGENEWSSAGNDKRSQQPQWPTSGASNLREQHAQQRFSPPNNMV